MPKTDWKDIDGTVASVTETPSRGGNIYEVVFTYEVDGHWCGGTYTTYESYRKGDSIAVRYDPKDPDRNDLSEQQKHRTWILIAVIAALVVLGVVVVVLSHSS